MGDTAKFSAASSAAFERAMGRAAEAVNREELRKLRSAAERLMEFGVCSDGHDFRQVSGVAASGPQIFCRRCGVARSIEPRKVSAREIEDKAREAAEQTRDGIAPCDEHLFVAVDGSLRSHGNGDVSIVGMCLHCGIARAATVHRPSRR